MRRTTSVSYKPQWQHLRVLAGDRDFGGLRPMHRGIFPRVGSV